MSYFSADGEEGYPSNLNVRIDFSFEEDNKFNIQYIVTTDNFYVQVCTYLRKTADRLKTTISGFALISIF
jgi:hypothetical protein